MEGRGTFSLAEAERIALGPLGYSPPQFWRMTMRQIVRAQRGYRMKLDHQREIAAQQASWLLAYIYPVHYRGTAPTAAQLLGRGAPPEPPVPEAEKREGIIAKLSRLRAEGKLSAPANESDAPSEPGEEE